MLNNRLYILFIFFIAIIIGCKEEPQKITRNIIDTSYLETREFQSFQNQYKKEQKKRKKLYNYLEYFVNKNRRSAKQLSLPVTIDSTFISNVLKQDGEKDPFGLDSYLTLGNIEMNSFTMFLFLKKKFSVYKNNVLLGATIRDEIILDIQPLASFRENLIENLKSHLEINSSENIELQIEYLVSYSKQERFESVYNFPVTNDGLILVGKRFELNRFIHKNVRYNVFF